MRLHNYGLQRIARGTYSARQPGRSNRINIGQFTESTNLHFHGLHVSPLGIATMSFAKSAPGKLLITYQHSSRSFTGNVSVSFNNPIFPTREYPIFFSFDFIDNDIFILSFLNGIKELTFAIKDFQVGMDPTVPSQHTINGKVNPTLNIAPGETQLWQLANIDQKCSIL